MVPPNIKELKTPTNPKVLPWQGNHAGKDQTKNQMNYYQPRAPPLETGKWHETLRAITTQILDRFLATSA